MQCQLCDQLRWCAERNREMKQLTVHHLIPKQTVRRKQADPDPTIDICSACHRQIHSFYSNLELAKNLNTLEKLKQDPRISKFLTWLGKQTPNKKIRVHRSK